MIVYNVNRQWFTMKADAEAYRKALGLPPSGTFKLSIDSREELAALLNGLAGLGEMDATQGAPIAGPALMPFDRQEQNALPDDANVPQFLKEAWAKLEKGMKP